MTSRAEPAPRRKWTEAPLWSLGLRPFFLLAALWAALAMGVWVVMLSGGPMVPTALDPVSWHAHALLFGYFPAVVAGFLLTAVPSWTGRPPLAGTPLAALAALWVAGRLAVATSAHLPALAVAALDTAFLAAREITAARNRRNLVVVALLVLLAAADALFHHDAASSLVAAQGPGLRLGLAVAVALIALIGGRIVPAFTRNWLRARGEARLPAPFGPLDAAALALVPAALLPWVLAPWWRGTGLALLAFGALHLARLARWRGWRTGAEPLVWILHAGYAFVPLGALALGAAILAGAPAAATSAQHLWMAGAVGVMTLAVMTRAPLGHTGRALHAGPGTVAIYAAVLGAVAARAVAGLAPGLAPSPHVASAALWIAGFGGFAALFGPMLLDPRADEGGRTA